MKRPVEDGGPLTFLSLMRADRIPPSRDNAERLRLMRARLVPVVGNGHFHFRNEKKFKWQLPARDMASVYQEIIDRGTAMFRVERITDWRK